MTKWSKVPPVLHATFGATGGNDPISPYEMGHLLDRLNTFYYNALLKSPPDIIGSSSKTAMGSIIQFNKNYGRATSIQSEILQPRSDTLVVLKPAASASRLELPVEVALRVTQASYSSPIKIRFGGLIIPLVILMAIMGGGFSVGPDGISVEVEHSLFELIELFNEISHSSDGTYYEELCEGANSATEIEDCVEWIRNQGLSERVQ